MIWVSKSLPRRCPGQPSLRKLGRAVAPISLVCGCSDAPSHNILGSYFPSWMICVLAGIVATVVVRQLITAGGLDKSLPFPLLVYLALIVAFSFATWLLWLG